MERVRLGSETARNFTAGMTVFLGTSAYRVARKDGNILILDRPWWLPLWRAWSWSRGKVRRASRYVLSRGAS